MKSISVLTLAILSAFALVSCDVASQGSALFLRVCADPDNLPYSNARGEGFENLIAQMLARDLGLSVEYVWWTQRRGFVRDTLNAGRCDVVMGLPAGDMALTTRPYYKSTYVFVTRRARELNIRSFDDPQLRGLRIGIPLVGDDGADSPPGHALARRGLLLNVAGYSVFGDYLEESPPAALIDAVATGAVDIAAAWGPLAGYFAQRQAEPLNVVPVRSSFDEPPISFTFGISMAVRHNDQTRRAQLEKFIERRQTDIDRVLAVFHVPRVDGSPSNEAF